jgi:hypothetical protein
VDAADFGAGDFAGELNFFSEAGEGMRGTSDFRANRLERYATELEVCGLVNLTHAAAADEANNPEARQDKLAGREGRCHRLFIVSTGPVAGEHVPACRGL